MYRDPCLRVEVYVIEPPSGARMLENRSRLRCLLPCESGQLGGYQVVVSVVDVHGIGGRCR